jgi:hydrogenase nickel incorporation protein HypB
MRVAVEEKVLNANQIVAAGLRAQFEANQVLCLNLISAPGSGKTTLLENTLARLSDNFRLAVLTGDIQTDNDARRLQRPGCLVRQITTGGTCHLDASMIQRGLEVWNLADIDILFIENVGNLVCPSSYDLGENAKVVLLSVTEGEDKPLKYPAIFSKAELCLITKRDLLPYVPFNVSIAAKNAASIHPGIEVLELSCQSGEGIDAWLRWIEQRTLKTAAPAMFIR